MGLGKKNKNSHLFDYKDISYSPTWVGPNSNLDKLQTGLSNVGLKTKLYASHLGLEYAPQY